LHVSAFYGHADIVELLLQAGMVLNLGHFSVILLLCAPHCANAGALRDASDAEGTTPLGLAVLKDQADAEVVLRAAGAAMTAIKQPVGKSKVVEVDKSGRVKEVD
jgi:ankyrin repeat protein